MHAQYPTTFEQMIVSMQQRLRPTDAYLWGTDSGFASG